MSGVPYKLVCNPDTAVPALGDHGRHCRTDVEESAMKLLIRPSLEPEREVDVTQHVIAAVAAELWRLYGGSDLVNWLEAERALEVALQSQDQASTVAPRQPGRRIRVSSNRRAASTERRSPT